ncbi:hypothetical protein HK405_013872, partial [Cladochytrium tenue]
MSDVSMDGLHLKNLMRPVKKILQSLKTMGSLPKEEKAQFIRETVYNIGEHIISTVKSEYPGQPEEHKDCRRLQSNLWKYVALYWPNAVHREQLVEIYHKVLKWVANGGVISASLAVTSKAPESRNASSSSLAGGNGNTGVTTRPTAVSSKAQSPTSKPDRAIKSEEGNAKQSRSNAATAIMIAPDDPMTAFESETEIVTEAATVVGETGALVCAAAAVTGRMRLTRVGTDTETGAMAATERVMVAMLGLWSAARAVKTAAGTGLIGIGADRAAGTGTIAIGTSGGGTMMGDDDL